MTRYAELYREEQAEKEKLQRKLEREIGRLVGEVRLLRSFILENQLDGQLAEWALKRVSTPSPSNREDT